MKQAIIIPTCKKYKPWLDNLLKTMDTEYPIIIVYNKEGEQCLYESLAIKTGIELGLDEFFVLHDTCEVKNNNLFKLLFDTHYGEDVFINPQGQMLMNKYTKRTLSQLPTLIDNINSIKTKWGAVLVERDIPLAIKVISNPIVMDLNFKDGNKFEMKLGRNNMVIENEYLKKYKGAWDMNTVNSADRYIPE